VKRGPARVLEALRAAAGPCSGQALSEQLGVTRTQVWKHVEALRRRGYAIEGEPGGGYRLVSLPDRLYPQEIRVALDTRWLARDIEHYEEVDSTNRVAFARGQEGAAHGHTVIAEGQSAGRGRLGRSFFSPPHLNLYTSILLRPPIDVADAPTLIPAASIAVADAVAETLGAPDAVEIKWPNDVLVGGLKTIGILMELQAEATRVGFAVLGIGVNLNVDPALFPEDFRRTATSLRAHAGHPIARTAFACRLYSILERVLDEHAAGGFDALRPRYEARFRMVGRRVRVLQGDAVGAGSHAHRATAIEGTVRGVDTDGALLLAGRRGESLRVIAGDVTLAKEDAPT